MIGTEIHLEKIGNGWTMTIEEPYDTRSGILSPMFFPTLKEAFEYLEKHLGKI